MIKSLHIYYFLNDLHTTRFLFDNVQDEQIFLLLYFKSGITCFNVRFLGIDIPFALNDTLFLLLGRYIRFTNKWYSETVFTTGVFRCILEIHRWSWMRARSPLTCSSRRHRVRRYASDCWRWKNIIIKNTTFNQW